MPAKRVRIYVNEEDRVGDLPASLAIVQLLETDNADESAIIREIEVPGGIPTPASDHLAGIIAPPVVIEWTGAGTRIDHLLGTIKEMHGMVTVEDGDVTGDRLHPLRRLSTQIPVQDVMSRDVAAVDEDAPVRRVVELMLGKVYRAVPVVRDGSPVGIITNSDLLLRGGLGARMELLAMLPASDLGERLDGLTHEHKTARQVMTPTPVTVTARTALADVAGTMTRQGLKRLPVVDEPGRLIGMISRLDLLWTVALTGAKDGRPPIALGLGGDVKVAAVTRRDVPTVHPDTPVAQVLEAVASTQLNRAVVVDVNHHLVGLVTDEESLQRIAPVLRAGALQSLMQHLPFRQGELPDVTAEHRGRARTARDLMRVDVPVAYEDTLLSEAIEPMLRGREKVIAVVDREHRLLGIVDRADILHGLVGLRH